MCLTGSAAGAGLGGIIGSIGSATGKTTDGLDEIGVIVNAGF